MPSSRRPRAHRGWLFAAARAEAFEVVACPLIFEGLRRGLGKPYFRERGGESDGEELLDALELLRSRRVGSDRTDPNRGVLGPL